MSSWGSRHSRHSAGIGNLKTMPLPPARPQGNHKRCHLVGQCDSSLVPNAVPLIPYHPHPIFFHIPSEAKRSQVASPLRWWQTPHLWSRTAAQAAGSSDLWPLVLPERHTSDPEIKGLSGGLTGSTDSSYPCILSDLYIYMILYDVIWFYIWFYMIFYAYNIYIYMT